MEFRYLGATGLQVSQVGFGNMINWKPENEEVDFQIIKRAIEHGINFFDTAENYAAGQAEVALGKALKRINHPREQLVISTKIFKCSNPGGNPINREFSCSRKHIIDGMNASLKRLQLDYVDVAFSHVFDPDTPIEEVCRGFNQIIEDGKAFYWATSNWSSVREQIIEAINICDRLHLIRPIADQCLYNQVQRKNFEVNFSPLFDKFGYGSTVYSPLAGGILTGKYNETVPEISRYSQGLEWIEKDFVNKFLYDPISNIFIERILKVKNPATMKSIRELGELAKELGCTQAQLSLAWVLKNKVGLKQLMFQQNVSTAIIGARSVEQLDDTIKALEVYKKYNNELEERIEKILGNRPEQPVNYRTFTPYPHRR